MSASKLIRFAPVEDWLGSVAYEGSGSKNTEDNYRRSFQRFLDFSEKRPEQILEEYEKSTDRAFKRYYAAVVRRWIADLTRQGLTKGSIKVMVSAVQSFFKHHDLPLGHIPQPQYHVVYHNRDMTREELADVMNVSLPRDRAFYIVMAQSGLRPVTICKLKIKHIEYDRLRRETPPVKIAVPAGIAKGRYHSYFTFMSSEAIQAVNNYLKTRKNLTQDSYVFVKYGTENSPMNPAGFSAQFNKTVRMLKDKGVLNFEVREEKPSEIRLYNLRKFFKKHTHEAGEEFSEYWMGHKGRGVMDHYRTRDPEFHRKLYAEKAAPYLRVEHKSPSETELLIQQQAARIDQLEKALKEQQRTTQELLQLKETVETLQDLSEFLGLSDWREYVGLPLPKGMKDVFMEWRKEKLKTKRKKNP